MVFPGTDAEKLASAANRVFGAITADELVVPHGPTLSVRCSMGGAVLPRDGDDVSSLLRAADDALLRAKREGKHRICFA